MNRFPWGSLMLLLFSYITFGYALSAFAYSWETLLFIVAWVILRTTVLVFPEFKLERCLYRYFSSDILSFSGLVIAAAFVSIVIIWLHVFLPILMILFAEILARIDLKNVSFCHSTSFSLLFVIPLCGIVLGCVASSIYP